MPKHLFLVYCCLTGACCGFSLTAHAQAMTSAESRASSSASSSLTTVLQASSCDYTSVRTAVGIASTGSVGTTIKIPPGDCDWGVQQMTIPAGIYLRGAGQNLTTIRRVGIVPTTRYLIAYDCTNGQRAVFSDINLVGNGDGAVQDKGLGLLNGCVDFDVSRSTFSNFVFSAVYVGESSIQRGVIYDNIFVDNYSPSLRNLGYGVVVYGAGTWPELDLGSENAVFVEDNYFSGNRHNIASNNGAVYVFRYNKVFGQDSTKDFSMTDAHGLSSSKRGTRSVEIYNNQYAASLSSGLQRSAIGIRGGDGVIYNNVITGTISRTIELMVEGFNCGTYPGADQIRSLHIWDNQTNRPSRLSTKPIDNTCATSIGLNRDYFLTPKPGYKPFPYPHPLRATP